MEIVTAFNLCINSQDLRGLAALMSEDHVFIDSGGAVISGKQACLAAWAAFFTAFPDYRNLFETISVKSGHAVVIGRSECSDARLAAPALWSAKIAGQHIAEWRVFADTSDNRMQLGI